MSQRDSISPTLSTDLKKHWIPDNESKSCGKCTKEFTTFRRRHHCRKCGHLFCSSCSNHAIQLDGHNTFVRVCDSCYDLSDRNLNTASPVSSIDESVDEGSPRVEDTHSIEYERPLNTYQLPVPSYVYIITPLKNDTAELIEVNQSQEIPKSKFEHIVTNKFETNDAVDLPPVSLNIPVSLHHTIPPYIEENSTCQKIIQMTQNLDKKYSDESSKITTSNETVNLRQRQKEVTPKRIVETVNIDLKKPTNETKNLVKKKSKAHIPFFVILILIILCIVFAYSQETNFF
eukprot:NODE_4699_length_1128_cov_31.211940_g4166_i0.p1 GENE.NODE_4699_length_1128_cov_31.211940_g4166_i0~~NODE_4699_length_1128_cov_31.211940_g4166_i0.p1  ORF type:complete len:306 (+),score=45.90 NODE_4699_length_1128_cov_31.211940_g4166_i0:56-919(+)